MGQEEDIIANSGEKSDDMPSSCNTSISNSLSMKLEISGDEDSKESTTILSSGPADNLNSKQEDAQPADIIDNEAELDNEVELLDNQISDDYGDDTIIDFSGTDEDSSQFKACYTDVNLDELKPQGRKKKPLGNLHLHYKCEWRNCGFETDEDSTFHVHVSYHIPDVDIKTLADGEEVYVCLWAECNYLTGGAKEIQRHVTFHSYHTKIKNIGAELLKKWNLPDCTYGDEYRNLIPEEIAPMICEWKNCEKEFNNVQVFLYHTLMHVNESFNDEASKKEKIKCKWQACQSSGRGTRTGLTYHMHTHTKEKVVACPTCGQMFASNTKLQDHCQRQLQSAAFNRFQCSHCLKRFPSLRLLKDHMRGHVNFYRCCYCDMTCSNRHTFSAHIRYKHLDSKPFQCTEPGCKYMCKTKYDLQKHMYTHNPEFKMDCEEPNCKFSCRDKRTLKKHMINDHGVGKTPVYCCHMPNCDGTYRSGSYLTRHLVNKHCLRWPSGHSKFMYFRGADGNYQLQTVRYESVKLFGEHPASSSPSKPNSKATNMAGDSLNSFKVSTIESDPGSGMSKVLISIEDESGRTINSCSAPEIIADDLPKNAMVIASADSMEVDIDKEENKFDLEECEDKVEMSVDGQESDSDHQQDNVRQCDADCDNEVISELPFTENNGTQDNNEAYNTQKHKHISSESGYASSQISSTVD